MSDRVRIMIRTTSPLSHFGDEKLGNQQLARRMPVVHDGRAVEVPVVSGNAIRGQLRRIAADDILTRLGVEKVPQRLYHTLFSGGTIAKGDKPATSHRIEDIREVRDLVPLVGLFGCAWGGEILPGWLLSGILWPLCRETAHIIGHEGHLSMEAHELVTNVFYTRRDDEDGTWTVAEDTDAKSAMIFEAEAIVTGARMATEIRLRPAVTPQARGLLGLCIKRWVEGGIVGGQSGKGHGRFVRDEDANVYGEFAAEEIPDITLEVGAYERHMEQHRGEIREWLAAEGATLREEEAAS